MKPKELIKKAWKQWIFVCTSIRFHAISRILQIIWVVVPDSYRDIRLELYKMDIEDGRIKVKYLFVNLFNDISVPGNQFVFCFLNYLN